MTDLSTVVVAISRSIQQVFTFVADGETIPQWHSEIIDVRRLSEGRLGVGTSYETVRMHLRERITERIEITAYEPLCLVAFARGSAPPYLHVSYQFQAIGPETRVTYSFDLGEHVRGTRHLFSKEAASLSILKKVLEATTRAPGERAGRQWG